MYNFPSYLIDTIVQRSLSKHLTPSDVLPNDPITFYVRLNNLHTMKLDEKTLKNILHHHVIPTNKDRQIKLISYFKPVKLCSFFSTRPFRTDLEKASVVYQFSCTEAGCQASYIGHTTCTLKRRGLQHKYSTSAIYKHFINDHSFTNVPASYLDNFTILHRLTNSHELRITEAILIKEISPIINVKYNEMYNTLNLYR